MALFFSNDVLSKFGTTKSVPASVKVALTFLWQDCTPLRASMNTKTVVSDIFALFKITAAAVFVKVKKTRKTADDEDIDDI